MRLFVVVLRTILCTILYTGLFALVGCQTKLAPTKAYVTQEVRERSGKTEIQITSETVILDARSAFDFDLGHLPGAINLDPAEFAKQKAPFEGELQDDLSFQARRLARLGVDPSTPVLIIGKGAGGQGEEGRLAFILTYMGIENVTFSSIENFNLPLVRAGVEGTEEAPVKNKDTWKPNYKDSLIISRKEFQDLAMKQTTFPSVIDVRSEKEYLRFAYKGNAINIPWTDFIDSKGEPNQALKSKLEALNLPTNQRLAVVEDGGTKSALAAFVLYKIGYKNTGVLTGGYRALQIR